MLDTERLRLLAQAILDELGEATPTEEPERPSRAELPDIEFAQGPAMKVKGPRPNGLEGLIVHYSASRVMHNTDRDALGVMQYGAGQGYRYLSISRTGKIFVPDGHDWNQWGYHAGPSKLPNGSAEVSARLDGVEICNPGILTMRPDGYLYPWYNKTFVATDGRWTQQQCRHFPAKRDNIAPGWYLPYTPEQEVSLVKLCLWMAKTFPNFKTDWILGHDEVAPGRKTDPGGCLSMTMPEFRAHIKELL